MFGEQVRVVHESVAERSTERGEVYYCVIQGVEKA
jgi:hypothetical protein